MVDDQNNQHAELLEQKGVYYKLVEKQMERKANQLNNDQQVEEKRDQSKTGAKKSTNIDVIDDLM